MEVQVQKIQEGSAFRELLRMLDEKKEWRIDEYLALMWATRYLRSYKKLSKDEILWAYRPLSEDDDKALWMYRSLTEMPIVLVCQFRDEDKVVIEYLIKTLAKAVADAVETPFVDLKEALSNKALYEQVVNMENAGEFFVFLNFELGKIGIEKLRRYRYYHMRAFEYHPGVILVHGVEDLRPDLSVEDDSRSRYLRCLLNGYVFAGPVIEMHPYVQLFVVVRKRVWDNLELVNLVFAPLRHRYILQEVLFLDDAEVKRIKSELKLGRLLRKVSKKGSKKGKI